jgi:hypothetical protein
MSNNLVKIDTVYHSKHLHLIKTNHPNMVNKQVDTTKFGMIEKNVLFNATFNNISVISWRSVLLVEETGGPGENNRPIASD